MDAAAVLLAIAFVLGLVYVWVRLKRSGLLSDDSEERLAAAMAPPVVARSEPAAAGPALVVLLSARATVAELGERFASRWGRAVTLAPDPSADERLVASAGDQRAIWTAGGPVVDAAIDHVATVAIAPAGRSAPVDRIRFALQLALAQAAGGVVVGLWLPASGQAIAADRLAPLVSAGPLHHAALASLFVSVEPSKDGIRTRGLSTFGMPELSLVGAGAGDEALLLEAATQSVRAGRAPRPGDGGDLLGDGGAVRAEGAPDGSVVLRRV